MSNKPIFVATHPRACSTAFERVFMTRRDILNCVHEPFGDAFYFGPERLSARYENDEEAREESGFAQSTFKTIFERIEREHEEGKRLFIKDITHYLVPPEGKPATIAPSLGGQRVKKGVGTNGEANGLNGVNGSSGSELNGHAVNGNGVNGVHRAPYPYDTDAEAGNPTVVPASILKQFHFTFLIRHPRNSIPSYFRCTIPPLDSVTGFYDFMPSEAGYDELRRVFDFLRAEKQVGPTPAGDHGDLPGGEVSITVIDADDLLDNPDAIIKAYCKEVGIEYKDEMLNWDTEDDHARAKEAFEKWKGFHDDAINSTSLKPRDAAHVRKTSLPAYTLQACTEEYLADLCLGKKKKIQSVEQENAEWKKKYGEEGQRIIRETVDQNIPDYEYLKSFAIKV